MNVSMNTLRLLVTGAALAVTLLGCSHLVVLHDPLSATEHNDLGVAYERSGKFDLAATQYRRSLRLDDRQARTWVNLGNAEAAGGRWPAAQKSYRRALREAPGDADAMNNLAVALLHTGGSRDEARKLAGLAVAAGGERDSIYRATLEEASREN